MAGLTPGHFRFWSTSLNAACRAPRLSRAGYVARIHRMPPHTRLSSFPAKGSSPPSKTCATEAAIQDAEGPIFGTLERGCYRAGSNSQG